MADPTTILLSDLSPSGPPGQATPVPPKVDPTPYDPAPAREALRGQIAMTLVGTLAFVLCAGILMSVTVAIACSRPFSCSAETSALASLVTVIDKTLSPLVGLVGAVAGFYFGEKSARSAG